MLRILAGARRLPLGRVGGAQQCPRLPGLPFGRAMT